MPREGYFEISFEVPNETRERWDEFIEKHDEYTYRSTMLRSAVELRIKVDNGELELGKPGNNPSPEDSQTDVNLEPIESSLANINDRLTEIEDQIDFNSVIEATNSDIQGIMNRAKPFLPLVKGEDQIREMKALTTNLPPKERAQITGIPGDITAALRESENPNNEFMDPGESYEVDLSDVESALARLEEAYGTIHSTMQDGKIRYFEVKQ